MARHGRRSDDEIATLGRVPRHANRIALTGLACFGMSAFPARSAEAVPEPAQIDGMIAFLRGLDLQNAYVGLFLGLVGFAATAAVMLLRQQREAARRDRALRAEIADLRGADDLATLLMGSERQLLVSWQGRDGEPRFEGDPSIVGDGAPAKRALAFGAWLSPGDASAVDTALEQLKQRGEAFHLTARTADLRYIDIEGRTIGGRAILRLRDVTADRADLLHARGDLAAARADSRAMTTLLDAVAHPLWIRDGEGNLAWANQAYLTSVEAADLSDATSRSLELLDSKTRAEAGRQREAGAAFSARVTAVMAGQRSILDVVERPTGTGSAGIAVDVSELEAVRVDLQRQMEAHVRTLDQLPTAVAIFDASQKLIFSNAAYQQLWKLDPAFLESRPTDSQVLDRLRAARRLQEQDDFHTWKTEFLSGYHTDEPNQVWWHLPDRRTIRVVTNPNPKGGVTYLFDDVSERFQLESQVTALTRVQSETLDTLKEGVVVFGSDGRLKLHNRAFAEMWHLSTDLTAANPHIDAVIRACRLLAPQEEPWVDLRGAVAGLADLRMGMECRMDLRDGSALDCTAQPLPDGATLLTFIDVTASVSVARALTERNDALERASRLRDEFVHHVSYELRSPLTNVIGFAQLLGDQTVGALNPRQRDYADHIMRSAGSLLAMLNDILDLASIDTGSLELSTESVDIRSTIDAALRGLEDRLAEASLEIVIDAPDDIGSFAADGKRIRQILFSLLSNAVGFSSPGQTIRVLARKRGHEVMLEVKDEGRGIPPEIKARIFDRFESHTLGTRHRGVGLGLSIVRSFVELHGGRIELTSFPGKGTTVTCTFPNELPSEQPAKPGAERADEPAAPPAVADSDPPVDGPADQNALPPLAAE